MGYYSEYLDKNLNFEQLTAERKAQLRRISELRGNRDVLVIAADLNKATPQISINYSDLLAVSDQLSNLSGSAVDLVLETPGGSGEVAEDIVHLLHEKYEDVGVIVPGYAKSAGTIIAMAGDEILMDEVSALGPIDAQIGWQGKIFSADALLEGMEKIKREVTESGVLNKAYIPLLQGISPGELQSAENALKFSRRLVTKWLAKYKFKNWKAHSSNGQPVTEEEKEKRAEEIAEQLCDHGSWLTHARSIKIDDLEYMRLKIINFSEDPQLSEAIRRYYTLIQMSFQTNIYKLFETPTSQIYRFLVPNVPGPDQVPPNAEMVFIDAKCNRCQASSRLQANLGTSKPLQKGNMSFPKDNKYHCPKCGAESDLSDARRQIEAQTKKTIVE